MDNLYFVNMIERGIANCYYYFFYAKNKFSARLKKQQLKFNSSFFVFDMTPNISSLQLDTCDPKWLFKYHVSITSTDVQKTTCHSMWWEEMNTSCIRKFNQDVTADVNLTRCVVVSFCKCQQNSFGLLQLGTLHRIIINYHLRWDYKTFGPQYWSSGQGKGTFFPTG